MAVFLESSQNIISSLIKEIWRLFFSLETLAQPLMSRRYSVSA